MQDPHGKGAAEAHYFLKRLVHSPVGATVCLKNQKINEANMASILSKMGFPCVRDDHLVLGIAYPDDSRVFLTLCHEAEAIEFEELWKTMNIKEAGLKVLFILTF